jgi:hypothetical protein
MKFEEHCTESIKYFGKPYEEVHKWLDEFADSKKYGMKHRMLRYHQKGIEEAVKLFGEEIRKVAKRHILSDLEMEEFRHGLDHFPKNQRDYMKMGLF